MPPNFDPNVALAAVGVMAFVVGPYVKMAVDILRMAVTLPQFGPPLIAFVLGTALCPAVLVAASAPITPQALAISPLVGIMVTAQAIGLTELQNKSNDVVGARKRSGKA